MKWDYDIIIVGAGVAGSSSAIALALEGYRLLLLDRAVFPRHKPCGEGITPPGAAVLESLGLLPEILARGGVKVRGLRVRSYDGVWAGADLPAGGEGVSYGIVMRRYLLDHLLVERAKSFSNVTVREGFRVIEALQEGAAIQGVTGHPVNKTHQQESFRAPLTIGADGGRSVFHNRYGIRRTYLPRKRFGIAGHLTGIEGMGSYIEVILQEGSEIYIAPCDGDITLVAFLLEEKLIRLFQGALSQGYVNFLKAVEGFGERIKGSELLPPVLSVGPLGLKVEPVYRPGLLLIGDSAGFLDPITGEGMTMALKSVQAALPVIKGAFARENFGEDVLARYATERSRALGDVLRLTQLILHASRFKWLTNRAIRRLSRDRRLLQKFIGVATGQHRYSDITLGDRLALLRG